MVTSEGEKGSVPEGAVPRTVANLRLNSSVMSPVLVRMSTARDKVPCIDTLIPELDSLYRAHGYTPQHKTLRDESWSIRYLYGVLKGLTWKKTAPKDPKKICLMVLKNIFQVLVFKLSCMAGCCVEVLVD
eukprot:Skav201446  [mRNA]  locus=scaffold6:181366:181755:- [translate_table: standard]